MRRPRRRTAVAAAIAIEDAAAIAADAAAIAIVVAAETVAEIAVETETVDAVEIAIAIVHEAAIVRPVSRPTPNRRRPNRKLSN